MTNKNREPLYLAAINCPHEIDHNRVVLHYDGTKPGHNALAQLGDRLAKAAQQVPPGFALVPIEPTAEMIAAGVRHIPALHVWNAMIAAARPKCDGSGAVPSSVDDWTECPACKGHGCESHTWDEEGDHCTKCGDPAWCADAVCKPKLAAPTPLAPPVESSLTERDPSKTNAEQGLYRKFDVRRVDGSDQPGGKHHGCDYFVLDVTHDRYALAALRTYAQLCHATHPDLAYDMERRYNLTNAAPTPVAVESPAVAALTDDLRKLIEAAAKCISDAVTYEQDGFDSPPMPATEWDYNADQLAYALRDYLSHAAQPQGVTYEEWACTYADEISDPVARRAAWDAASAAQPQPMTHEPRNGDDGYVCPAGKVQAEARKSSAVAQAKGATDEPRNVEGMTRSEFEHYLRVCTQHDNVRAQERGIGPKWAGPIGITPEQEREIADRVERNYPLSRQPNQVTACAGCKAFDSGMAEVRFVQGCQGCAERMRKANGIAEIERIDRAAKGGSDE